MAVAETDLVDALLDRARAGDRNALSEIAGILHSELRRIAASSLSGQSPEYTWQPTDLVNELWTRLLGRDVLTFSNRAHFLGAAAHLMRAMVIDHARARLAQKRLPVEGIDRESPASASDMQLAVFLTLDDALARLARMSPRQAQIVELRYFAGLTVEETAQALTLSSKTVKREWAAARAWLHGELCPVMS